MQSLEGSNIKLTDEMVTMMLMQRIYELNSRVAQVGRRDDRHEQQHEAQLMHGLRALLLAFIPALSLATEATILPIDPSEAGGLQRALLDLAQQRLEDTGLVLDREHAWLHVTGTLPVGAVEALPTWSSVAGIPVLPLTFELRAVGTAAARARCERLWRSDCSGRSGSHSGVCAKARASPATISPQNCAR